MNTTKRIALVHDWLVQVRGGEKVFDQLVQVFPSADVLTLIHVPGSTTPAIESRRIVTSGLSRIPGISKYYRNFPLLFPIAVGTLDLRPYDVVISSSHSYAKGVRVRPDAAHICYCHTPIRYVWGPRNGYFRSAAKRIASWAPLGLLKAWDVRTSGPDRISSIICNSYNIQQRVRRAWKRESTVVHPGIDVTRFAKTPRRPSDFFLLVSSFVPYKREDLAIEAFQRLGLPLVIAGEGPGRGRAQRRATKPNIKFLGHVDDATLNELFAKCRALIYPQEEDFGMTAVEAQAAGAPVIAYGEGGAQETVVPLGGGSQAPTGIFFKSQSAQSLAAAVREFAENEHKFDASAIRSHASQFSIERFRTGLLDAVAPWIN